MKKEDVKQRLNSGSDVVLVDIRDESSYERAHLPDAINIDAFQSDFVEQVKEIIPDINQEIILYGSSPTSEPASISQSSLLEAGYKNVQELEGGIQEWATADFPLEGTDIEVARAEFQREVPETAEPLEEEIQEENAPDEFAEEFPEEFPEEHDLEEGEDSQ